jgi:hypothetical protein
MALYSLSMHTQTSNQQCSATPDTNMQKITVLSLLNQVANYVKSTS